MLNVKKTSWIGLLILFILMFTLTAYSQVYLPKNMENSIVTFEKHVVDSLGAYYQPHGTGFLLFDDSLKWGHIITNRHILENRDSIFVRFNTIDDSTNTVSGERRRLILVKDDLQIWLPHPDSLVDLAIVCYPKIPTYAIELSRAKLFTDVKLADDVLYLGFPLLDAAIGDKNYPIVRGGVVAFKTYEDIPIFRSHEILIPKNHILIDGLVMPGNSGSPVLSPLDYGSHKIALIGVLSSHIFSRKNPEGPFAKLLNIYKEKDFRLGICIPADRIIELVENYREYIQELNSKLSPDEEQEKEED